MRPWGKVAGLVASACAVAACTVFPSSEHDASATEAEKTNHTVVLEVAGSGVKRADVTYVRGEDRTEDQGAELPWRKTVTTVSLDGISVFAQNTGDAGELTCTITVDGKVRQEVAVEGELALVACDLAAVPAGLPTPT